MTVALMKLTVGVLVYGIGIVLTLLWFRPWNGVLDDGNTVVSKDGKPYDNAIVEKWAVRALYALAAVWPLVLPFLIFIRLLSAAAWVLRHLFPKTMKRLATEVLHDFGIKEKPEDP